MMKLWVRIMYVLEMDCLTDVRNHFQTWPCTQAFLIWILSGSHKEKSARKAWKILCITTYRISNVIACVGVTSLKDAASGSSLAASDFFW